MANDNSSLLVGDYFYSLSEFLTNTTNITDSLKNISTLKASDKDIRDLEEIKSLFADIGCYRFVSEINDIVNVGIRGNNKYAADIAKKILDDFYYMHSRIISAEKIENFTDTRNGETLLSQKTQVLSKAIKILYHQEATRKMGVLAVDDAPSMIKTISSVLDSEYKVYGLTKPAMVEKFLRQITPELFLLDYQMPEISGFELVPVIRSFEEHKDTPIIFLTSMGTIDHVSAAYSLGACDFIVKPFQDTILAEKVAKHIVRKNLF
jgi:PleD family two-component response regulator